MLVTNEKIKNSSPPRWSFHSLSLTLNFALFRCVMRDIVWLISITSLCPSKDTPRTVLIESKYLFYGVDACIDIVIIWKFIFDACQSISKFRIVIFLSKSSTTDIAHLCLRTHYLPCSDWHEKSQTGDFSDRRVEAIGSFNKEPQRQ